MAEYIEREALEKMLNERLTYLLDKNGPYDYFTDGYDEAVSTVEEFLAADVAPVVHGRWKAQLESERDGFPKFLWLPDRIVGYICSNCGNEAIEYVDDYFLSDYCPYCGAKMDGGPDE